MFVNHVELAVFTLFISTAKLFVQLLNKLNLTFLFSPFCSDIGF